MTVSPQINFCHTYTFVVIVTLAALTEVVDIYIDPCEYLWYHGASFVGETSRTSLPTPGPSHALLPTPGPSRALLETPRMKKRARGKVSTRKWHMRYFQVSNLYHIPYSVASMTLALMITTLTALFAHCTTQCSKRCKTETTDDTNSFSPPALPIADDHLGKSTTKMQEAQ